MMWCDTFDHFFLLITDFFQDAVLSEGVKLYPKHWALIAAHVNNGADRIKCRRRWVRKLKKGKVTDPVDSYYY
jgi:hypothetical protein